MNTHIQIIGRPETIYLWVVGIRGHFSDFRLIAQSADVILAPDV